MNPRIPKASTKSSTKVPKRPAWDFLARSQKRAVTARTASPPRATSTPWKGLAPGARVKSRQPSASHRNGAPGGTPRTNTGASPPAGSALLCISRSVLDRNQAAAPRRAPHRARARTFRVS
jgi:hypothetical protein